MIGKAILCWGLINLVVIACMYLIIHFDANVCSRTPGEIGIVLGCSGVNGWIILQISRQSDLDLGNTILLCVVAGCLLFACVTDCKTCEVYQFTWWIAGIAGGFLWYRLWEGNCEISYFSEQQMVSLIFYIILQEILFSRFYGRADCHAFVVCAVIECGFGMNMLHFLIHMSLAFGVLALIQAAHCNIDRCGNLKDPVAFLPYITFSFWVLLFFGKSVILKRISEITL